MLDEIDLFHEMRLSYLAQNWVQAEQQLIELKQRSPSEKLYEIYAGRIAYFRNNPPSSDWDGVFVFQSKN
jgi:adenylate cyclase